MSLLRLEPVSLLHAPAVQDLARDPALARLSDLPAPYPPDGATRWIEEARRRADAGQEASFAVLVDDEVVGACGLVDIRAEGTADLTYWIGRRHWGRGYGAQAVARLVATGFGPLGLRRLWAAVIEHNRPSLRILKRAGFRWQRAVASADPRWPTAAVLGLYALERDAWARGST